MKLVNLCKHAVFIHLPNGVRINIPSSVDNDMLRCLRKLNHAKDVEFDDLGTIPIYRELITSPILPPKEDGVRYIVNDMVARSNPTRNDFYIPAQHKLKPDGSKFYSKECFGLLQNPYYKTGNSKYAFSY